MLQLQTFPKDSTIGGKLIVSVIIEGNYGTLVPLPEDELAEKRKYQVGPGRVITGQPVEFEAISEPWGQFKLADGSQVKVKLIMLNAARLDEYTDQGDPLYQFQFQQVVAVVAPEELKRKNQ